MNRSPLARPRAPFDALCTKAPRVLAGLLVAAFAGGVLTLACGGADKRHVELSFAALVGAAPFSCTQSYMLGTPAASVQPTDLRLYVYDVALVRADGTKVPLALDTDGQFQVQNVALLDFEDATGTCHPPTQGGTTATHTKVVGTVEDHPDYRGIHFRIGVPTELNHLNAAMQPAPLNVESMFWSWQDGHILLSSEWRTAINAGWQFRVAESLYESEQHGCMGSHTTGYTCPNSFQPIVELADFDVVKDTVKLDLAPLFQQIDFGRTDFTPLAQLPSANAADNATLDYQPGCHTDEWDAECVPMFAVLGIDYLARGMPDPAKQKFASKQ